MSATMRALLVVNPAATTTSPRVRSVLTSALASEFKVDVVETTHRAHAAELAAAARRDGLDVVVVLGGDGTLNEVINGLLEEGPRPSVTPRLGIVPGGCANVAARALGLPVTPVEATGVLLDSLRAGRSRLIGLGRADERYFAFCTGLGIDGGTVRRVERTRGRRPVTGPRYVRSAAVEFFAHTQRRNPVLTLQRPGSDPRRVCLALVCNTRPWTFLGDRAVNPCPRAGFETGLDVFALHRAGTLATLRHLAQSFGQRGPRGRSVVYWHDEPMLTITADRPLPFQVDGDYLGERSSLELRSVPAALRVLA
jgi:diacylglycerol kinase family enzyme